MLHSFCLLTQNSAIRNSLIENFLPLRYHRGVAEVGSFYGTGETAGARSPYWVLTGMRARGQPRPAHANPCHPVDFALEAR